MNAQESSNLIVAEFKAINQEIGTLQDRIHHALIKTAVHIFVFKDTSIVEKVLNGLAVQKGFARVESVAYWFKHVVGVDSSIKNDVYKADGLAKDTYLSALGIAFTYDKAHLATAKEERFKFYKIAPVELKELKAPDDVAKITSGVEAMMARALILGTLTESEIITHLEEMMSRIETAKHSKSTKEWVAKYYAQHPSEAPTEGSDDTIEDEELMAELQA